MFKKYKFTDLENITPDEIINIKNQCFFISSNEKDLRTKGLIDKVKKQKNINFIFTDLSDGPYFEDYRSSKEISVIIDVSLIKRTQLAHIFDELLSLSEHRDVFLYIYYSLVEFSSPPSGELKPNKRVSSVHPRFSGWASNPGLGVVAIVGLGYEESKGIGAVEYLESERAILFIPDSSETEYRQAVEDKNSYLLGFTEDKDKIDYDVENPVNTIFKLDSVLSGLEGSHKPVLLPFGPKILFTCSLLVASAHSHSSVWHVSGEEDENVKKNQKPVNTFGFQCRLSARD